MSAGGDSNPGPPWLDEVPRCRASASQRANLFDDVRSRRASFVHGAFVEHDEWAISDRPRVASAFRMITPGVEMPVVVVQLHGLRDPAGKSDPRPGVARGNGCMLVSDPELVHGFEIVSDPEVSDHRALVLGI